MYLAPLQKHESGLELPSLLTCDHLTGYLLSSNRFNTLYCNPISLYAESCFVDYPTFGILWMSGYLKSKKGFKFSSGSKSKRESARKQKSPPKQVSVPSDYLLVEVDVQKQCVRLVSVSEYFTCLQPTLNLLLLKLLLIFNLFILYGGGQLY